MLSYPWRQAYDNVLMSNDDRCAKLKHPSEKSYFALLDWGGSAFGTFGAVNLPSVDSGLSWDDSKLYINGTLSVIPESQVAFLASLSLLALLRRKR